MSSVRLRIVITENGLSVRERALLGAVLAVTARLGALTTGELVRLWDELVVVLRRVWEELTARTRRGLAGFSQSTRQMLCGVRGHDDQMRAERNHLALSCGRCGRVTSGWELHASSRPFAMPSRHHAVAAGPRIFEMARRRS
jgi:hypothetical protein